MSNITLCPLDYLTSTQITTYFGKRLHITRYNSGKRLLTDLFLSGKRLHNILTYALIKDKIQIRSKEV